MSVNNEVNNEKVASKSSGWRAQVAQLAAIVLVVFLAKGALAEPFYVPSGSMEPTLQIGDAILASKFAYGYSSASLPMLDECTKVSWVRSIRLSTTRR